MDEPAVRTSSRTGRGVDELAPQLRRHAEQEPIGLPCQESGIIAARRRYQARDIPDETGITGSRVRPGGDAGTSASSGPAARMTRRGRLAAAPSRAALRAGR